MLTTGALKAVAVSANPKWVTERTFIPALNAGLILPCSTFGGTSAGNKMGTEGPYTSASKTPTLSPLTAAARAKPAQTVDLPTPPFPAATATNFFIFGACEAPVTIGNGMKGTILNYQIKKYKISLKKRALIPINYFKLPKVIFLFA
jgi:hypothetical protein